LEEETRLLGDKLKVLLMGIGSWGSRIVNDLCFSDKETRTIKVDVVRFRTWDILSWKMIIAIAVLPLPIEYFFTTVVFQFLVERHYHEAVLSGYYIFGLVLFLINFLVLWLLKTDRLEKTRFHITENDQFIINRIKKRIKREKYFVVDKKSQESIYKYLKLQRVVFPICLLVGFFVGAFFSIHFYRTVAITEVIGNFVTGLLYDMLSRWLSRYSCEMLSTYAVIPFVIPSLLASAVKFVIFPFYLPPPFPEELPEPGVVPVKRDNVTGYAFLLYEETLENVFVARVAEQEGASLSSVLFDEVERVLVREITEEGKAFDAIMFFGEMGCELTEEFASICGELRRKFSQSLWVYLHIPKNFISEKQHQSILTIVRSSDGTFFEEETSPLFRLNPERERELRVRTLERLLAVGELEWERSKMGLDVGHIKFFLDTKMVTSLGYGYVAKVPESSDKDYRLLSDLYYVTVEECITLDMDYRRAGSCLAIVKRECALHDDVAIHDYDTIRDFLWERYGRFIQVFDVEYLQVEPYTVSETFLERIAIKYRDVEGNLIVVPETVEEREKYEQNRALLSKLEETKMAYRREEICLELERVQWSISQLNHQKRMFLDRLRYRNLMVDDVKEKELLMLFGRIDPEDVLEKYMAETRYEREFLESVQHGLVLDPSVLYNGTGPDDGLARLLNEYKELGIGALYVAPTYLENATMEKISKALELLIPDDSERNICSQKILGVFENHSEVMEVIIEKSKEITRKCETFIQELISHLADAFEVTDDHPGLRLLAEEIWIVYSEKGYLMGWGEDSKMPEVFDVIRSICKKLRMAPFDMTNELQPIIEEWPLVKEEVAHQGSLYVAQFRLRYMAIDDKRPIIDSIRYYGDEDGKEKRRNLNAKK
jgi:hypothetical protein